MKVAIFGCLHGMMDEMYRSIARYEKTNSVTVDLVLVCGDCQTLRHSDDLRCISVPNKYKSLGDFHEYYSGKKKVPKLTLFVGGNHEASNYLMTLPYGGWVCDNFYYLGYCGVVRYKNLRIAGVSGIYKENDCSRGRFEKLPFDNYSIKSIYHTRRLDIFRLQLLAKQAQQEDPIDVFLSHDWPARIYDHGNKQQLLRYRPDFIADVKSKNGLGNPLTEPLVNQLKPRWWFAAHLHCKFQAKVMHAGGDGRCTEFLSLNKIQNQRNYMEVLDIDNSREQFESDDNLYHDAEWLTILRKTFRLEEDSSSNVFCPRIDDDSGKNFLATDDDIKETINLMNKCEGNGMKIERNFRMTEPVIYDRPLGLQPSLDTLRTRFYPNFQTEDLTNRLQLVDKSIGNIFDGV